MALPPCHTMVQFFVQDDELSCQLYQRSGDMGLGVPFNIASYALLLRLVAHVTKLLPGEFVHVLGDAHIYKNHVDALMRQLKNEPRPFPRLQLNSAVDDIDKFRFEDLTLLGYEPHDAVKMEMSV